MTSPLTRERVLAAAFQQADELGVDAVTMRAVADRLGMKVMSLYHHVPSKKAMLDGLVDLCVRAADLPVGDVTAEQWVRGVAAGMRGLAQAHPRLVPLLQSRALPLADAETARPFEAGLAAFVGEGYGLGEAFAAVQTVAVSLLAMAQLEAMSTLGENGEESALAGLPDAFPLLRGVEEQAVGLDDFWTTLLDALVVGLRRPVP